MGELEEREKSLEAEVERIQAVIGVKEELLVGREKERGEELAAERKKYDRLNHNYRDLQDKMNKQIEFNDIML